jgi:hypothetical protein
MSERESDFEFDFFEEPVTQEASGRDRTLRRPLRGPRGPRTPRGPVRPRTGFTPLLRLLGLIAFAILVVVLLLLWAQGCQEEKKRDSYGDYMTAMRNVASESERVGRELSDALTTQGIKTAELQKQLSALVDQQEIGAERARSRIDPPGPLLDSHEAAIEALEFRVAGLAGLVEAFRRTQGSKDAAASGALLASQAERLVASDVIWDDLFKQPGVVTLRDEDVSGVEVPDSNFVQTPELASTRSMVQIWERINGSAASGTGTGAGTPTGLHGTNIESVTVVPGGATLSTTTENVVEASTDLAFAVAVANSGDFQEVKIEVTLTIQQSPTPIVKKQTIELINPDETKTVVFREFLAPDFSERQVMRIDVDPVPGERTAENNTAEYPVSFSLAD